jgi:hypothetical protein
MQVKRVGLQLWQAMVECKGNRRWCSLAGEDRRRLCKTGYDQSERVWMRRQRCALHAMMDCMRVHGHASWHHLPVSNQQSTATSVWLSTCCIHCRFPAGTSTTYPICFAEAAWAGRVFVKNNPPVSGARCNTPWPLLACRRTSNAGSKALWWWCCMLGRLCYCGHAAYAVHAHILCLQAVHASWLHLTQGLHGL